MFRIAMIIACLCSLVTAEPFVYQGQLQEDGEPANGEFDFRFELYDSETGGVRIGPTNAFGNLDVADGLFTVDLDFGNAAFEGGKRWLRIQVRPGANVGAYTELQPRVRVNGAPLAAHALTADRLSDPDWFEDSGVLSHGEGTGRVLINRDSPIAGDEFFGVHSEQPGEVGMYVSSEGNADPFYGFANDGAVLAKMFVDSSAGNWLLEVGNQISMIVNSVGEINFLKEVTAFFGVRSSIYEYLTPQVRKMSIPGAAFRSTRGNRVAYAAGVWLEDPGIDGLVAWYSLPDGARVSRVTMHYADSDSENNVQMTFYRNSFLTGQVEEMGTMSTGAQEGASESQVLTILSGRDIDNQNYGYFIEVIGIWNGRPDIRIFGSTVEYTVNEAG